MRRGKQARFHRFLVERLEERRRNLQGTRESDLGIRRGLDHDRSIRNSGILLAESDLRRQPVAAGMDHDFRALRQRSRFPGFPQSVPRPLDRCERFLLRSWSLIVAAGRDMQGDEFGASG